MSSVISRLLSSTFFDTTYWIKIKVHEMTGSARIPCPFKLAWLNAKRRFNRGIMFAYFLRSFLSILYYQQRALPHLFTIPAHLTHHPLYWTVCTDRVYSFSFITHNLPFSTRKVFLFSIALSFSHLSFSNAKNFPSCRLGIKLKWKNL